VLIKLAKLIYIMEIMQWFMSTLMLLLLFDIFFNPIKLCPIPILLSFYKIWIF
jgi:hypothetical protein